MNKPANSKLIPEGRALLKFIYQIQKKYILSGQHNFPGTISHYTNRIFEITGKYPAIWGQDFGFTKDGKDGINNRPTIIKEAIKQHEAGSIVTLMWHAVHPKDEEPNNWYTSVRGEMTDEQWKDLITQKNPLNLRWRGQIDTIAAFLQELADEKIPVLWRPYHEMNGNWFWWGNRPGRKGFIKLWEMLFKRLTEDHKLNNLIWIWNANVPISHLGLSDHMNYKHYYPGKSKVDIVATNIYNNLYREQSYHDLVKFADGKPIALGEIGKMPSLEVLKSQVAWSWFMEWTDHLEGKNSMDLIKALYDYENVLSRQDVIRMYKKD